MPWVDSVASIVHAWYLGNASGDAIADVIFGKHNPSGKLSLTFPKREEDVPSYGHFHSEDGKIRYGEDLYVVCCFVSAIAVRVYSDYTGLQTLSTSQLISSLFLWVCRPSSSSDFTA